MVTIKHDGQDFNADNIWTDTYKHKKAAASSVHPGNASQSPHPLILYISKVPVPSYGALLSYAPQAASPDWSVSSV